MVKKVFENFEPEDDCLTTARAAKILGVTAVSVIRWIEAGRIRAHRTPGGHRRIRLNDLLTFIAGQKVRRSPQRDTVRILIVDDDDLVRSSLTRLFISSEIKCLVDTAGSGFEAGFKALSMSPDLIILDLVMPGIDGIRVCEIIRANPATARVAIILLTAYADDDTVKAALDSGADAVISKPARPSEILETSLGLLSVAEGRSEDDRSDDDMSANGEQDTELALI